MLQAAVLRAAVLQAAVLQAVVLMAVVLCSWLARGCCLSVAEGCCKLALLLSKIKVLTRTYRFKFISRYSYSVITSRFHYSDCYLQS